MLQLSYSRKCSINWAVSFLVLVTGSRITAVSKSCGQLSDQFVLFSLESQSRMWCISASRSGPLLGCVSFASSFKERSQLCQLTRPISRLRRYGESCIEMESASSYRGFWRSSPSLVILATELKCQSLKPLSFSCTIATYPHHKC
jgi:hypothetical protein